MTKAEVARLLTLITAFDRRTIGETDVEAWHLVLADLDPADCADAVKAHYTTRRDWLMPADVRTYAVDAARRREGRQRRAILDQQVEAENPTTAAVTDKTRPLAALMAGTPVKPVPRGGYDGLNRRTRDNARLDQARAELDECRRLARAATPGGTTPEHPSIHNTPEALQ